MRVVIDTNVVVSSLLRGRNPKKIIEHVLRNPSYEWIISEEIREEYEEVICRDKFNLSTEEIEDWLRIFSTCTLIDTTDITVYFPRDPKDEKFIKCILASNADYFITGDYDFRSAQGLQQTTVISVSEFVEHIVNRM